MRVYAVYETLNDILLCSNLETPSPLLIRPLKREGKSTSMYDKVDIKITHSQVHAMFRLKQYRFCVALNIEIKYGPPISSPFSQFLLQQAMQELEGSSHQNTYLNTESLIFQVSSIQRRR